VVAAAVFQDQLIDNASFARPGLILRCAQRVNADFARGIASECRPILNDRGTNAVARRSNSSTYARDAAACHHEVKGLPGRSRAAVPRVQQWRVAPEAVRPQWKWQPLRESPPQIREISVCSYLLLAMLGRRG